MPVLSLLIVGAGIFGATSLEDFALVLAAGLFIGSYSSIFVAAPLLAWWKEREPQYRGARRTARAPGPDRSRVRRGRARLDAEGAGGERRDRRRPRRRRANGGDAASQASPTKSAACPAGRPPMPRRDPARVPASSARRKRK